MERITLKIKDDSKLSFFLKLLQQFDFVEIEKTQKSSGRRHDLFASAGMWKNRNIDAGMLRKKAWERSR